MNGLQITSPAGGAVVNPGQAMKVTGTSPANVPFEIVGLTSPIDGMSGFPMAVPAEFSLRVPWVTFASSNTAVATVDRYGNIRPVGTGARQSRDKQRHLLTRSDSAEWNGRATAGRRIGGAGLPDDRRPIRSVLLQQEPFDRPVRFVDHLARERLRSIRARRANQRTLPSTRTMLAMGGDVESTG